MGKILSEPLLIIVAGGTALIQAILQLLIAFNVPITSAQQTAITVLAGIVLPLIARMHVTPLATLPPGVAGAIADAKALKP